MAPFCSCPASLVSRKFFAVGPGCAKCFFFLLRSVGRRDLSAGPEQKKKTPPRVFFFLLRPRGKAGEGEAPLEAGTGPEQKKKTPPRVFFFLLRPRRKAREGEAPLEAGTGPEQKVFFCSGPTAQGASPSLAFRRGRSKKKHPGWCFFLLWPRAGFQRGFSFPCLSPGPQQKKKTPWVVFFFLLRPRADAHSLTAGLGGDASPSPGWCFFFLLRPRPDRGGVFFFAVAPPGRSLTHCGLGRFRQGPGGVFFFLLRPRRVFLDNSKKCLGYYIGSKKTRRGHSKKKNTTSSGYRATATKSKSLSHCVSFGDTCCTDNPRATVRWMSSLPKP